MPHDFIVSILKKSPGWSSSLFYEISYPPKILSCVLFVRLIIKYVIYVHRIINILFSHVEIIEPLTTKKSKVVHILRSF